MKAIKSHLAPALILCDHYDVIKNYQCVRSTGTSDWLLFYTLSGQGQIENKINFIETNPNSAVLIPPGVPHYYRTHQNSENWNFYWVHFHPWSHWQNYYFRWPKVGSVFSINNITSENHFEIIREFEEMQAVQKQQQKQWQLKAMLNLESVLYSLNYHPSIVSTHEMDDRISMVVEFIGKSLNQNLEIFELSKMASLSSSRFCHLFTEQVGISPQKYVIEQRISKSISLLTTSRLSIKEICNLVGFHSVAYFSRIFTHKMGFGPSKYRQMNKL